ncbi:MAG: deoxyhypusine synthase family protein [Candidatus Moranbacteria bacterium]|nr:deoxyhypusine synthase family protein [Candidatus Moranbacteria bacterium]
MIKSNFSKTSLREKQTDFRSIKQFIDNNFFHFNAAALADASKAYSEHLEKGGKMMVTLAGAMSTAELGITLAEMIRQDKVHAICCTGANLEEDIFNLVAHDSYRRVPHYRDLSPEDEENLFKEKFNRVTDTCIPEEEAMKRIEMHMWDLWRGADKANERLFPYEYMYRLIRSGRLDQYFQIDPKNSWMLAASEKNLPIFVPGWEDSTLGNMFVAFAKKKEVSGFHIVKSGLETMDFLIDWYKENTKHSSTGFFQIGGGIAGDFPICVVPLIEQDLRETEVAKWGYFCQISDSTTSYGSYSGAEPNEKITWGKLGKDTPRFVIESDASIVAPLVFAYILGK